MFLVETMLILLNIHNLLFLPRQQI